MGNLPGWLKSHEIPTNHLLQAGSGGAAAAMLSARSRSAEEAVFHLRFPTVSRGLMGLWGWLSPWQHKKVSSWKFITIRHDPSSWSIITIRSFRSFVHCVHLELCSRILLKLKGLDRIQKWSVFFHLHIISDIFGFFWWLSNLLDLHKWLGLFLGGHDDDHPRHDG